MIKLSFKNPYLVFVMVVVVAVLSAVLIPRMPVDILPQFKKSAMQILTLYPGMPAEVVEKDITSRMALPLCTPARALPSTQVGHCLLHRLLLLFPLGLRSCRASCNPLLRLFQDVLVPSKFSTGRFSSCLLPSLPSLLISE